MKILPTLRETVFKQAINNGLSVLTLDIETSHAIARTFYIGHDVRIGHNQVKVPSKVISIQYKWAHEKKAQYLVWDKVNNKHFDSRDFDDSKMIQEFLIGILPKADIVVTQNGDRFDFLVLNERAKALGLSTLENKPSIDILKLSRQSFKSLSHKLDYRSFQLGFGGKVQMSDQDWVDIEENGIPAEKKMIPYGLKDIYDTESLLWRELKYYKRLPVIVEKTILSKTAEAPKKKEVEVKKGKALCQSCRSKHRLASDVKKTKKGYKCNSCNNNF